MLTCSLSFLFRRFTSGKVNNYDIIKSLRSDGSFVTFMCIPSAIMWCFRPIREIYHLWTLAGGDVFGELKKHDLIKTFPPVCNMPK